MRLGRAGFTLLEAAVALTIVALAGVAAMTAFGAELRTAHRARHTLEAAALAEERLEAVRLLPPDDLRRLPDSVAAGRFAPPLEVYRWETVVTRGDEPDLHDATVRILWDDGAYEATTRLWRPPPADPMP